MRYYNKRFELMQGRQQVPSDATIAVPLREVEARLTDEIRGDYGIDKIDFIVKKVKDRAININKNYAEKTVYVHSSPLIYRDIFREMFPEYKIVFQP